MILKSPVSSIGNALAGKMPGLSAIQTSGQPGSDDPTVYVRGGGVIERIHVSAVVFGWME